MLPAIALRLRLRVVLALLAAAAVCMAATPAARKIAMRIGAMDMPGESRRVHTTPIPRMGGIAIFLGFLAGVLPFAALDIRVRGVLLGSLIIVILGVADDIRSLNPWVKLLGQCAAAAVAIACGVRINILTNPRIFGEVIPLGALSVPVTLIWIVGITNALNLIDGLDGLAAGVSGIGCASMLAVSLFLPGATDVSVLLAALGGACLGFLPFNRNPARVFMGDTGALLLGFVLSAASVLGLFKMYTVVTFAVPLLALALPLSDTVFAIVRRLYNGENPMKADRGHIHHRLLALGLTQKQAVTVLYAVSLIFGTAAVLLAANAAARF
ncbi:MAG: undecaprenyl/decaprenyl-phosphate alpha-N-acetylglucosaminyl 1-phosphate transferase, partial [Oscillospiraceae bacterium]|nr:undecaprenyl/decaprenyl-phosphate alpha-N-acetylglucosaminyl 1-phosphate transferase [Oscillospiraceae bacterium]